MNKRIRAIDVRLGSIMNQIHDEKKAFRLAQLRSERKLEKLYNQFDLWEERLAIAQTK